LFDHRGVEQEVVQAAGIASRLKTSICGQYAAIGIQQNPGRFCAGMEPGGDFERLMDGDQFGTTESHKDRTGRGDGTLPSKITPHVGENPVAGFECTVELLGPNRSDSPASHG